VSASLYFPLDMSKSKGKSLSEEFVRSHQRALVRLRQRLDRSTGGADAITVMAVMALLILAWSMGDTQAWNVHASSLSTIITLAGGLDRLGHDGFVKSHVMQWETQWANQKGRPLDIVPSADRSQRRENLQLPLHGQARLLAQKLPQGFLPLINDGVISAQTLTVLARATKALQDPMFCVGTDLYQHEARPYFDFWQSCPCLNPDTIEKHESETEQLVVLALIVFSLQNISSVRFPSSLLAGSRARLTTSLEKFHPIGKHEENVLVWIYLNTIDSWRVDSNDELLPAGQALMKTLWTKHWFLHGGTPITSRLRLFFSTKDFERRCLSYMRSNLNWSQLFET
jgi:hypothetical protein